MRGARTARLGVVLVLGAISLATPGAAQEAAAPDSLGDFLKSLSDSTDLYFGPSSAPVDTAGLDTALTRALARPWLKNRSQPWRSGFGPWFSFNRADGPLWGGTVGLGREDRGVGVLRGRVGYVAGPNLWRGRGSWTRRWSARDRELPAWWAGIGSGRWTELLDADGKPSWLRVARALVAGSDHQDYLRRNGGWLRVGRELPDARIMFGFRSQLDSPLPTTTTWNLLDRVPEVIENAPAARGQVALLEVEAATRLPRLPLRLELKGESSLDGLDNEFDYRRLRARLAGDLGLGRVASLVPELEYGRLDGDAIPQASFFLGGAGSLRSLETRTYAGTGRTFGRLDLIFVPDLLSLARLPHPAFLPIQGAVFAGSGAVWGRDPFGGPGSGEAGWPERDAWRSEVGVSLLYRPGLPDPSQSLRIDYARAVGPGDRDKISISFSAPLDIIPLPE